MTSTQEWGSAVSWDGRSSTPLARRTASGHRPGLRATESAELDVKGTGYEGGGRALGDARGYELTADLTAPLDAGHRFLFRLIGQYYDRSLFRDFAYEKSQYGAGGLTWNASDATSA